MRTLYFCPVVSSIFFLLFSSPNLSRRRLDVHHTSTHGVACVKHAARGSLKVQDSKYRQKFAFCAPSHNFVRLYLRNEGMYRQSEKNLCSSNISSTGPHNMATIGPLMAEIGSEDRGTPSKFQWVSRLAFVTAATSLTGCQPNFA